MSRLGYEAEQRFHCNTDAQNLWFHAPRKLVSGTPSFDEFPQVLDSRSQILGSKEERLQRSKR